MSLEVDVLVVGAGMFGSAAAKYLSRAGADTMVVGPLEPVRPQTARLPEFSSHHDESRIAPCLGWDRFWGTVDSRSAARYRDIEAESGVEFFHECGALALVAASLRERTEAMLRASEGDGVVVERMLEAELRQAFPGLGLPPMVGGVEGLLERESAGYVNPRQLVEAQTRLATASGARLLRGTAASVRRDGRTSLWHVDVDAAESAGRVTVRAERVLIAAGSLVNHTHVLPSPQRLDLQVFTEPNLLFEVADRQLPALRRLPTVVTIDPQDSGSDNLSAYLIPPVRYPDGRWYLRVGPAMQPIVRELHTAGEAHAWYAHQRVTPEQSDFLTRMSRILLPQLEPVCVREACCVVDKTPSRYPYIGHLDEGETLTVAVGGNGHGARGSDEIGRLASTVVLEQPWDFPLPQETFAPMTVSAASPSRPDYLRPPFGLC
ncbi:NAD(P)/FAD-dependent oxidoreductase [Streptomyces sp. NPDC053474]|uniref:NAD(P)/FAD-dependent oxidoreductase n=1 Tax=Streptomyces sp. NPDC053474 TaxID=3365704 RepID=UPI0037D65B8B